MQYEKILSAFDRLKVMVIGDAMLDEYVHTAVTRTSPEAPVQVARVQQRSYTLGGAANVANNLASLGAQVEIVGIIGDDENGRKLVQELAGKGIKTEGIFIDKARPTTTKTRIVAGRHQMLRVDTEETSPISKKTADEIIQYVRNSLPASHGVIISDYLKGVLTDALLQDIISLAVKHQKPVIVGPKGNDFRKYRSADVIIPNTLEAATACDMELKTEDDFRNAGRFLLEQLQCQAVLITRGEAGLSLYRRDGNYEHVPACSREVYDVSGAGDTVLSVFGLSLFSGAPYPDAARLANIAAGIVVGKAGTATAGVDEITGSLEEEASSFERKFKNLKQLKTILEEKKKQGKRIVFTNGCFDLLHIGHIKLLEEARKLGDELVVAINSDSSTRALKGAGRPIIPEMERAHIMSALSYVNYVILFSEPTPEKLIKGLKPDVLVKGADYKPEEVVGREIVEGYGGRVALVPLAKDKSTSRLVRNIASNRPIP